MWLFILQPLLSIGFLCFSFKMWVFIIKGGYICRKSSLCKSSPELNMRKWIQGKECYLYEDHLHYVSSTVTLPVLTKVSSSDFNSILRPILTFCSFNFIGMYWFGWWSRDRYFKFMHFWWEEGQGAENEKSTKKKRNAQ
jgi:hypothetical protein